MLAIDDITGRSTTKRDDGGDDDEADADDPDADGDADGDADAHMSVRIPVRMDLACAEAFWGSSSGIAKMP